MRVRGIIFYKIRLLYFWVLRGVEKGLYVLNVSRLGDCEEE